MGMLTLKNICKTYANGFQAVNDVSINAEAGEFLILLGPSGCGKSTILNMIAGLENITGGELNIGGKVMNDILPKDRNIAMVFQNYALYPHMNVYNNMAFGLKLRKFPKEEIKSKIEKASEILQLEDLLLRKPAQLSGGQRQRVALGRAIVRKPDVFLFDEPLSNLDAKLRAGMRTEIAKLHKTLGTTMVYVTHDQVEAMTLGTKIAIMNKGCVQQIGKPIELYEKPANKFVAGFIGSPAINFIDVSVGQEEGRVLVRTGEFSLLLKAPRFQALTPFAGKQVTLAIRPEHLGVAASPAEGSLPGELLLQENLGHEFILYFKSACSEEPLAVRLYQKGDFSRGGQFFMRLSEDKILFFEKDSGERVV